MGNVETLRAQLEALQDPELEQTLGELGAIHDIQLHEDKVEIFLRLIQPLHFVAQRIDEQIKQAVRSLLPDAEVATYVREIVPPRPVKADILPDVKNLVAIASGKGGVGKSTVAANIAVTLAQHGAQVGFLDADIHGPSAPVLFGLEGEQMPARKLEDGRIIGYPLQKYGVKIASMGFVMSREQAAILRGPLQAGYFTTLVEQIDWGELDYLIFDLPPGTGDIQLTLTQRIPLTGAAIVTTPQDISLADVRRGIAMFRKVRVDVLGVIENMSFYICPNCGYRDEIFQHGGGQRIAAELDTPFLGQLPLNSLICKASDEGLPVVLHPEAGEIRQAFESVTRRLVQEIRRINAQRLAEPPMEISL